MRLGKQWLVSPVAISGAVLSNVSYYCAGVTIVGLMGVAWYTRRTHVCKIEI